MTEDMRGKPTLFETVRDLNPKRNPAFTAVEVLEDQSEMRTFMTQYADYLRTSDDPQVVENAEQVALSNMGYITVYYGAETVRKWQSVFTDMPHPVFGRTIPFNDPDVPLHLGVAEGLVHPQSPDQSS